MKNGYIIWNTTTGVYDGAYADFDMAMDRFEEMPKLDGDWIFVQWKFGKRLSDNMFHVKAEEIK